MRYESEHIDLLYKVICEKLLENPDYVSSPRGIKVHEIINAKLVLFDPTSRIITLPSRKFSKRYFAGEFSFYMSGSASLEFIAHYAPFWKKVSDDGVSVNSCYGKRLFNDENAYKYTQLNYVIETLLEDSDSRKAIMMIYNPNDAHKSKDNPCTIMLQIFIRNYQLMMTSYMRSNDIWLGTPYDIGFFTILQELIFVRLKIRKYSELELGPYTHLVGSLHLYEKNFSNVRAMMGDSVLTDTCHMSPITTETSNQLQDFLNHEEQLRKLGGIQDNIRLTDPFLDQMEQWLLR